MERVKEKVGLIEAPPATPATRGRPKKVRFLRLGTLSDTWLEVYDLVSTLVANFDGITQQQEQSCACDTWPRG